MPLLYHAYVYLEFLILACTIYILAPFIVAEINARLSLCDHIEQTVDIALSQAEAMRQSILKKAFEGGLN